MKAYFIVIKWYNYLYLMTEHFTQAGSVISCSGRGVDLLICRSGLGGKHK